MKDPEKHGQRLCEVGKDYIPSHVVKRNKKTNEYGCNQVSVLDIDRTVFLKCVVLIASYVK